MFLLTAAPRPNNTQLVADTKFLIYASQSSALMFLDVLLVGLGVLLSYFSQEVQWILAIGIVNVYSRTNRFVHNVEFTEELLL